MKLDMARFKAIHIVLLLVLVETVSSSLFKTAPTTTQRASGGKNTTRQKKGSKDLSTSSSSGNKRSSVSGGGGDSLDLSTSAASTSTEDSRYPKPKSSAERRGWRKWHRKCSLCPEEMKKKWRDPSIKWICGAYQRARRSFKSLCMMHYRNCQDGTMFQKIGDHRCQNDSAEALRLGRVPLHGNHMFYDYKVTLSGDSSDSDESDDTVTVESYSSF